MAKGTAQTGFIEHSTINAVLSIPILIVVMIQFKAYFFLALTGLVFGTIWMPPDLDMPNSIARRNWLFLSWY